MFKLIFYYCRGGLLVQPVEQEKPIKRSSTSQKLPDDSPSAVSDGIASIPNIQRRNSSVDKKTSSVHEDKTPTIPPTASNAIAQERRTRRMDMLVNECNGIVSRLRLAVEGKDTNSIKKTMSTIILLIGNKEKAEYQKPFVKAGIIEVLNATLTSLISFTDV